MRSDWGGDVDYGFVGRDFMKIIFLHGLGQDGTSWEQTTAVIGNGADAFCPNLSEWLFGKEVDYTNLYHALEKYCEQFNESFCLCGLSLGGILALQYTIMHGDKVAALVLIGTQYRMPKKLLKLQNILFRFMPNAAFQDMGFGKTDFIKLSKSMMHLDFGQELRDIKCRTLVVCGEKDKANKAASLQLKKQIPQAQLVMLPRAGHEVNTECPKMLGDVLQAFLGNKIL